MDWLAHQTCPVSAPCAARSRCGSAVEPRFCCLEQDLYSLHPYCAWLLLQVQQPSRAPTNEGRRRHLSRHHHHSRLPSTKVGRRKAGCGETALLATRWNLCNRCHLPSVHRAVIDIGGELQVQPGRFSMLARLAQLAGRLMQPFRRSSSSGEPSPPRPSSPQPSQHLCEYAVRKGDESHNV